MIAHCLPLKADHLTGLKDFAGRARIDLTVVGPELPLTLGIVDLFRSAGLPVFGPSKAAAAIEGSKAFAKALMLKHGIPTARFELFTDSTSARAYARSLGAPLVVKADGLAAGKGVFVCRSLEEADRAIAVCLEERGFGKAGARIVIEEFLEGEEASCFALTDGEALVSLAAAQDHKRVFDEDQGPNTGGMGAYSPAPAVTEQCAREIVETIMRPTVHAMASEGRPYSGLLYAGLMLTKDGPKVLEFNCRFGDPETQPLLTRLDEDLFPLLLAVARGESLPARVAWKAEASVCVVLASSGYPGEYRTGLPISGIEEAEALQNVVVFHAGTALENGQLVTAGGRVLGVTALGSTISQATNRAYQAVEKIHFEGMHYRRDIAKKGGVRDPGFGVR
jgi:phosphoribosylamine--glycine ligase